MINTIDGAISFLIKKGTHIKIMSMKGDEQCTRVLNAYSEYVKHHENMFLQHLLIEELQNLLYAKPRNVLNCKCKTIKINEG